VEKDITRQLTVNRPINQQRHESTWLNSESATMTLFMGIKNITTSVLGGQLESCIQLHQTNRP